MPGNRALFDRAMEQSREAMRQKNWDEALKQSIRALQEFPQDSDARTSVAVALFNTGKFPQALQLFDELRKSDQSNPFFLEYIARIHERNGNLAEAEAAYLQMADLQQSRRLNARVVEALLEVLRLRPTADDQRLRVAQLLEGLGNGAQAAEHYMELARRCQQQSPEQAINYAETALRLNPNIREAKELISAAHSTLASAAQATVEQVFSPGAAASPEPARVFGGTGGLRGQQLAIDRLVQLAEEHRNANDSAGAIEQYERALKLGAERSDIFFNLGFLYQERSDHSNAVEMLSRATGDAEYALSAHYMLGTSYQELKMLPQAAQEYEQAIRLVPLDTIGKAEADDLIAMYEGAAAIYIEMDDVARAASLYSTLANFLQTKRWGKERAEEFSQKAKDLAQRNMLAKLRSFGGTAILRPPAPASQPDQTVSETTERMPETWGKIRPITDFLKSREEEGTDSLAALETPQPVAVADPLDMLESLPPAPAPSAVPLTKLDTAGLDEQAERYVTASEKYADQGLLMAALDACIEVIILNPEYLPIHLRMGEIYERDRRADQALAKYQLLIDTFTARKEPQRAIDVYYRLIELSPDTTTARSRLAELLCQDGRMLAAAEQVSIVASSYFRLGQTNKALDEYRRALQWAPDHPGLHAEYGQVLLKLERYEAALGEFRRSFELERDNLTHVARINIALTLMAEQPASIWHSLAMLIEQIKQRPAAFNDIQGEYRAALLIADVPVLHYILAILQQTMGQHQSALLEFDQAADLLSQADGPDPLLPNILVHQAMADSYIALDQAAEAQKQLELALRADSRPAVEGVRFVFAVPLSRGDIVRRMAEAYAASGNLAGAEQALVEAKRLSPNSRETYTKLADIYIRQGRLNEAINQMSELATLCEERQDLDRALETLEHAKRLAPNNIDINSRLANLYIRRGYLDLGIEGLVRVSDQQRKAGLIKDAVANLQTAAQVYMTLGRQAEARGIYDKILQIAPDDIEARVWLSFMHAQAFRPADAIAEKKQLVRIYLKNRDFEGAIAELHQIIGMDQNDIEAYYTLGDVLMRREEYEQAYRLYQRLVKMPNVETERVEALVAAAKRMMDMQQGVRKPPPA